MVGGQAFALPAEQAREVHRPGPMTSVPGQPPEVLGLTAVSGRVALGIDLRRRFGLPPAANDARPVAVAVEVGGFLYSLLVDQIGDVLDLPWGRAHSDPGALEADWLAFCSEFFPLGEGRLLAVLDVDALTDFETEGG
jgi:purine-binding chemotaxis protein CheW